MEKVRCVCISHSLGIGTRIYLFIYLFIVTHYHICDWIYSAIVWISFLESSFILLLLDFMLELALCIWALQNQYIVQLVILHSYENTMSSQKLSNNNSAFLKMWVMLLWMAAVLEPKLNIEVILNSENIFKVLK